VLHLWLFLCFLIRIQVAFLQFRRVGELREHSIGFQFFLIDPFFLGILDEPQIFNFVIDAISISISISMVPLLLFLNGLEFLFKVLHGLLPVVFIIVLGFHFVYHLVVYLLHLSVPEFVGLVDLGLDAVFLVAVETEEIADVPGLGVVPEG
jgi:hypothetical protein